MHERSRRTFMKEGSLAFSAACATFSGKSLWAQDGNAGNGKETIHVGLLTDLHSADKPAAGSRHYRDTPDKLTAAAKQFKETGIDFLVELGDLIDAADEVDTELGYLANINKQLSDVHPDRHYVLGNHCVDLLTKEEFLGAVGQRESAYSFDRGPLHFVILDACFIENGKPYGRKNSTWTDTNIPQEQLEWLRSDLSKSKKPTIVFAHQRLDNTKSHSVKNAAAVRQELEAAENVVAVFQGHSHQNDYQQIGNIHYCTLVAMVEGKGTENNGYSVLSVSRNGTLSVNGFVKQKSYEWASNLKKHG